MRLVVEAPRRQKSSPKLQHSSVHNSQRDSQYNSPHNSRRESQRGNDSCDSPTKTRRKSLSRHSSADATISTNRMVGVSLNNTNSSNGSNSTDIEKKRTNLLTKKVILFDQPFTMSYFATDQKYSIFKIDSDVSSRIPHSLICHGKHDSQVKTTELENCKDVSCFYKKLDIVATLYLRSLTSFVVPTYVVISTLDYEMTVEQFVEIVEDLMNLVSFR